MAELMQAMERSNVSEAKEALESAKAQSRKSVAAAKEELRAAEEKIHDAKAMVKAAEARVEAAQAEAEARIAAAKARDLELRGYQEQWTELNATKGYLVVPFAEHGVTFDATGIANYHDIFNSGRRNAHGSTGRQHGDGDADGHITRGIERLQAGIVRFLHRRRWMRLATRAGEKAFLDAVETKALKSTNRCAKQRRHADSVERNSLRDRLWGDVPKLALLFPQGGQLHVYPFDADGEVTLTLNPGDLVIFRGDLGHAGAKYTAENVRGHVYLDSAVIERERDPDTGETLTFDF